MMRILLLVQIDGEKSVGEWCSGDDVVEPKSITTKIVVHKKICQLHCAVFEIFFKVKNVFKCSWFSLLH